MTSDVVLTAALRNNLLSLQNTQSAIDTTQFRLASGRKVNSALDNPQSFFAAQALNNRASDLTRLLDGIGQSIQVVKAADNGVTALTKLVEQADSIAQAAQDALAQGEAEARVTGTVDLSGIEDIAALGGVVTGDQLIFEYVDANGTRIQLGAYNGATATTFNVDLNTDDSIDEVIAEINNLHLQVNGAGNALGDQAFEASLNDAGQLEIKAANGGSFRVQFEGGGGVGNNDAQNLALAESLGFGSLAKLVPDAGVGTNNVEFTAIASATLTSIRLYDSTTTPDSVAQRGDRLTDLVNSTGGAQFANLDAADEYSIGVNGGTPVDIALFQNGGVVTVQEFIDQINNNTNVNELIEADFDDATGQVIIRAIDPSVQSIEIGLVDNASTGTANFGFGVNQDITSTAADGERESITLAAAASELAQLEIDYNNIRAQIDLLVEDTGYRGTNLLNGDDLLTTFNETRTSSLTTEGVTFNSAGLGLDEADFGRSATVEGALDQVRAALESVRAFGTTLASSLSIIQTRETFVQNTINTLTEGADKLTIADQNEEGAKLLALQTRQQLGVTSLALASQSQQSILRLF